LSEALKALALGGSLTTLGYSASRKATIDVTDLIWKRAATKSFSLFAQPPAAREEAWNTIVPQIQSGRIKLIVAKTFPLTEASDALRYLVEGRPLGKVVLTI
jgi:NADPH2:quinone reductase